MGRPPTARQLFGAGLRIEMLRDDNGGTGEEEMRSGTTGRPVGRVHKLSYVLPSGRLLKVHLGEDDGIRCMSALCHLGLDLYAAGAEDRSE